MSREQLRILPQVYTEQRKSNNSLSFLLLKFLNSFILAYTIPKPHDFQRNTKLDGVAHTCNPS